ncbi:MAG: DUF4364 family protein [Oscillospiraceae bacterium]|jgi:hypothetical protein|nr:DUF4364 family protein [Oscillospiraceae bacterium]
MQRKGSPTEDKLLLLYAMHGLGPTTAEQLLRFFVDRDQMNYIDLQLALAELRENGLLRKQLHPLGVLYQPSVAGIQTLELFQRRIPYSRRVSVDDALIGWRARFSHEQHVVHRVETLEDGARVVRLSIMEQDEELLSITVRAPDDLRAERFCKSWSKNAGMLYARILRTLDAID